MNRLWLGLGLLLGVIGIVGAQQIAFPPPAGVTGIACAYNASPPTLTTGNPGWVQCDSTGKIITSGGGGGGGAVTIADGANVAQGTTTDPAWASGNGTVVGILKTVAANTGAAIPAGSAIIGKFGIDQTTPGTTNGVQVNAALPAGTNTIGTTLGLDPCSANIATIKPISITTNTTTNIVTGTAAKKIYVCYLYMQTAVANNVAIISGTTGATCGANTAALVGGTTAANGLNDAANSGQAMGNGAASIMQVLTNNDDICVITSAATPLAGVIKYVVQ